MSKTKNVWGKEPTVGSYIDDEERELIEAIEGSDDEPNVSHLTPERMKELQTMAEAVISEEENR